MKIPLKKTFKYAAVLVAIAVAFFVGGLVLMNGRVGVGADLRDSPALAGPPPILSEPLTLKVATFNIEDRYLSSADRPLRMRAIGARLMILDPDIVAFQEAFIAADRDTLLKELSSTRLKHHQCFPSGTVGSGLLIASALPIRETYFHRYSVSGPPFKVWEGDWWMGKGAALARLELPDGQGLLDFYNTDAQAVHGENPYRAVRAGQMTEFADFVGRSRIPGGLSVAAGSVYCGPGDEEFEALVNDSGLTRVMTGESGMEQILATAGAHTIEIVRTEPIEATVKLGERTLSLSGHTGYLSTITIRPGGGENRSAS